MSMPKRYSACSLKEQRKLKQISNRLLITDENLRVLVQEQTGTPKVTGNLLQLLLFFVTGT